MRAEKPSRQLNGGTMPSRNKCPVVLLAAVAAAQCLLDSSNAFAATDTWTGAGPNWNSARLGGRQLTSATGRCAGLHRQ